MKIYSVECPYVIGKLENHNEIKEKVLNLINSSVSDDTSYEFKTDWTIPRYIVREYWEFIKEPFEKYSLSVAEQLGYKSTVLVNYWFQQYKKMSVHDWHVHMDCQWTNVYYLEFPKGSPKTQMINPMTKEIIEFDVEEGSMLTFPSFIWHKAPQVENDIRKTIISFNNDFC
jgi:hypothetical protein